MGSKERGDWYTRCFLCYFGIWFGCSLGRIGWVYIKMRHWRNSRVLLFIFLGYLCKHLNLWKSLRIFYDHKDNIFTIFSYQWIYYSTWWCRFLIFKDPWKDMPWCWQFNIIQIIVRNCWIKVIPSNHQGYYKAHVF